MRPAGCTSAGASSCWRARRRAARSWTGPPMSCGTACAASSGTWRTWKRPSASWRPTRASSSSQPATCRRGGRLWSGCERLSRPTAVALLERNNRELLAGKAATQKSSSDLLDASAVSATSRYIEEQQVTQQLILDQQDQQLEMVSGSIRVLKHMSGCVGEELDEQGIMLDAFAQEMDHTHSRMDGVLRRMAKASHMTSDRRQWCAIAVLLGVLLLVLVLLFAL
ncbi:syntaxin-10 isoform X3 [Tamandua tetradactyla]|uniref:syntaxin-10 isoform X3 n=1 Tax=Tamandua tetradactyla TaxID=48850 RepID=UPI004053881B